MSAAAASIQLPICLSKKQIPFPCSPCSFLKPANAELPPLFKESIVPSVEIKTGILTDPGLTKMCKKCVASNFSTELQRRRQLQNEHGVAAKSCHPSYCQFGLQIFIKIYTSGVAPLDKLNAEILMSKVVFFAVSG